MVGKKLRGEEEQTWGSYKERDVNNEEKTDKRLSCWKWSKGNEKLKMKWKEIDLLKKIRNLHSTVLNKYTQ